jgi:hypothetical protein
MADILNSALTGEADFAGAVFGTPTPAEPTPNETPAPETQEPEQKPAAEAEAPKEEKKAPVKAEPKAEKKPKATKEETAKAVETATKEAFSEKTEDSSNENTSDDDLPLNPHFSDKSIADKPEGDDSEKGVSSWKEIKSEMKKAREERDRLKAELDAEKQKVGQYEGQEIKGLQEQIDGYKTQITQLEVELQKANFQRHPKYIREVAEPLGGIQNNLKSIAEANDADYSKLWNAIAEPDTRKRAEALEDLIGDFKRIEQLEVVKMADKYHDLARVHASMEQDSQRYAEADAAEKAKQEQEFIENDRRLQKAFTAKTWTNLEDRHSFLREIDGQDDWNSHLRNAKKLASETDLDRLKVEDRSSILAKAAIVPFLESAISHYASRLESVASEKDAKIKELQTQLDGFVKATPSLGNATEAESDSEDDEDADSLMNFGKTILGRR